MKIMVDNKTFVLIGVVCVLTIVTLLARDESQPQTVVVSPPPPQQQSTINSVRSQQQQSSPASSSTNRGDNNAPVPVQQQPEQQPPQQTAVPTTEAPPKAMIFLAPAVEDKLAPPTTTTVVATTSTTMTTNNTSSDTTNDNGSSTTTTAIPQEQQRQQQQQDDSDRKSSSSSDRGTGGLLPWVGNGTCCDTLRSGAEAYLTLPNDIQMLLPILAAYQRESDIRTVVELGSRLGSSTLTMMRAMAYDTSKRFATVDLSIRQPVRAMFQCEKECSKAEFPSRDFFFVEGNDLTVEIPFVKDEKKHSTDGNRQIDLLFIDTLHDAQQLFMELRRYPRFVRKYMVFHDSYSFKSRNEGPPGWLPPGYPIEVNVRQGLHPILREFLLEHPEWVEEMNNVHNNGLYVLRRRSEDLLRRRKNEKSSSSSTSTTNRRPRGPVSSVEPVPVMRNLLLAGGPASSGADRCDLAFKKMYAHLGLQLERNSPPCHGAHMFSRRTGATPLYNLFITQRDDQLPIASLLPVIMGQFVAFARLLPRSQMYVWGCEVSVAVAAYQGGGQVGKKDFIFIPSSTGKGPEIDACSDELTKLLRQYGAHTANKLPSSEEGGAMDLFVVSAEALSRFSKQQLQQVATATKHRIVCYGTELYYDISDAEAVFASSTTTSSGGGGGGAFELKSVFKQAVGLMMWERKTSKALLYVPEAKNV